MLRIAVGPAARLAVALAAGRSHQKIVLRNALPFCLMKVLAYVLRSRVIGSVNFDGTLPVVGGPYDITPSHLCARAEAACASK